MRNPPESERANDNPSILMRLKNPITRRIVAILGMAFFGLTGCAHTPEAKPIKGKTSNAEEIMKLAQQAGMSVEEFNEQYTIKVAKDGTESWILIVNKRGEIEKVLPSNFLEIEEGIGDARSTEASESALQNTFAKLKKVIDKYLGTPYKYGGMGPEDGGFGPSGLVIRVYKETMGIDLPKGAASQSQWGGERIPFEQLKPGDLIFFSTNFKTITSTAIYMGNNQMAIAEGSVKIVDINSWYQKRFSYGKRLLENPPEDTRETQKSRMLEQDQRIAENISEDELNGMPETIWKKLFTTAAKKPLLETPYRTKTEPNGIVCNELSSKVYDIWAKILGKKELKLISQYGSATPLKEQAQLGDYVPRGKRGSLDVFKNLRIGDLMFFSISPNWRTEKRGNRHRRFKDEISHVGIYVGNNQMLHAGVSTGVAVIKLSEYWYSYFVHGRRVLSWKNGKPVIKK